MRKYSIISADGHLETSPEAWLANVPRQYRDRLPAITDLPSGGEGWVLEGRFLPENGRGGPGLFLAMTTAGDGTFAYPRDRYLAADGSPAPGGGGPAQRLREQDDDGIDAEVLFPSSFAGRLIENIEDPAARLALVQAYNTYLAEYCALAPDRLIGSAVIPSTGIADAVAELRRCHELGLRSVSFRQFPGGGSAPAPEDDAFWQAALDLDMALSPHGMFGEFSPPMMIPRGTELRDFAIAIARRTQGPLLAIAHMLGAGTLDRFPDLRIYVAEVNAAWMPWALFRFDDNYNRVRHDYPFELRMLPSEYIRKHFRFGFVQDPMAMLLREHLPAEILMWGSDFPHGFDAPSSLGWLEVLFEGVPDDLKRRIVLENAAEHFHLDLDRVLTETPGSGSVTLRP